MGYACPVCETPHQDARHLANHLAFTALLRAGDHEAWLDEHVPDWSEAGEEVLAERVAPLAPTAEFEQVFEDTTGHDHRERGEGDDPLVGDLDPATRAAIAEAREMVREGEADENA